MQTRTKAVWGLSLFGLAAPLYLIPNHYPVFTPVELPLTRIDSIIPFVPETIWIYLSEYPLLISAFVLTRHPEALNRYVKSILAVLLASALIFILYPTTYPRDRFPLPPELDPFSRFLFELQRTGDSPLNCFPSLHVGSVLTSTLLFRDRPRAFLIFFGWAILICLSTLTTKQHYVWDVLGGAILTWLADRWFRPRPQVP
jgi:membrane-associated phospholipid phosphatase